jgi:site-specific recombinase XerD
MAKLYYSYANILLPPRQFSSDKLNRKDQYNSIRKLEKLVLTTWPNGKPCTFVNLYLQEMSYLSTGAETLETYASDLSPLITFCFESDISFEDLTDKSFTRFIDSLKSRQGKANSKIVKISNNHQVKLIDSSLRFLVWLQNNYYSNGTVIVGTESDSPQITIIEKFNRNSGRRYFKHINSPEALLPVKSKRVMPEDAIVKLKDEAFKKSNSYFADKFSRFGRRTDSDITMRYLYARRSFSIWYLERTGGRPSELTRYQVPDQEEYTTYLNLKLPVAKKRKRNWPTKNFSLTEYDVTELNIYIECRQAYVRHLIELDLIDEEPLEMIITEQGKPMAARSLQKDFSRLVKSAGLRSENISMSLFRHRFITLHILLELRDELGDGLESKHRLTDLWGEAVRRKICDRVAEKTGHADGDSLTIAYSQWRS